MTCRKCSATIPDDGLFCPKCGARADGNKLCPKCEKLIAEDAVFCAYCGAIVGEVQPVGSAVEVEKSEVKEQVVSQIPQAVDCVAEKETASMQSVDKVLEKETASTPKLEVVAQENEVEYDEIDFGETATNSARSKSVEYYNGIVVNLFEMPKNMDKDTFFAEALLKIACHQDTPDDIFEVGKFEPVQTEYRQYVFGEGDVHLSYSVTIGYDRQEKYYERVKKYSDGNAYYENVEKTRTVTDWKPFSGTYTGTEIGYAVNDEGGTLQDILDYKLHCASLAEEYDRKTSKSPAPKSPTHKAVEGVKSVMEAGASGACQGDLPGDRHKEFRCSSSIELLQLESHVAAQYVLNYSYRTDKCTVKAHAVKESSINGEVPSVKKENEKEIENHKTVKTVNLMTFFTLIFSIASSVLFPVALKLAFAVLGLVMFITNCIVKSKISKTIYREKEYKKKKALVDLLKKKGIAIPQKLKEGLGL